ncbi:MAG: response regulator [Armatimonadetes bacterium]|nr:response regulator [Armatimonadota bacterium]
MANVRILVLEDDALMRSVLAEVLTSQGFEVVAVGRGEEAVARASVEPFDLIVADIRMDGMDGLAAVEKAREHQPALGTLIVSGYATPEETARAQRLGVGGYLHKPFRVQELLDNVARILKDQSRGERMGQEMSSWLQAFTWAVETLARMADLRKVTELPGQLASTGALAFSLARALGLEESVAEQVRLAALCAPIRSHPAFLPPHFLSDAPWLASFRRALEGADEERSAALEGRVVALAVEACQIPESGQRPTAEELERRFPDRFDPGVLQAYERVRKDQAVESPVSAAPSRRVHRSLLPLASALQRAGDDASAWKAYEEILSRDPEPREAVESLLGQAELSIGFGRPEKAVASALEASRRSRQLGPVACAEATLRSGLLLFRMRAPEARQCLEQAVECFEELGLRAGSAQARIAMARLDGRADSIDLIRPLEVLLDPRHTPELARAADWLVPALLELSGLRDSMAAASAALRLSSHYPGALAAALSGELGPEARRCLARALVESPAFLPSEALELLAGDPDPLVRENASAMRDRISRMASDNPMLRVHSFGVFEVFRGEDKVAEGAWRTRKVKVFFSYLASQWGRLVPDEQLLEIFWPDNYERGRKNLYWTTSIVRKCLKGDVERGSEIIFRQGEALGLDDQVPRWHDLEEFDRTYAEALKADESGRADLACAGYRRLGQLYQAPYLDGCYMDWALSLRNVQERMLIEALCRLATHGLSRGDHREALEAAQRVLTLEPCLQKAHLYAMRAYLGLGEGSRAMEQFRDCERILKQEHGLEPSTELLEYYHRARLGLGDRQPPAAAGASS